MAKTPAKSAPKTTTANRVRMVGCEGPGSEKSVEVRKIANGFIVRESSYGPKGEYKSTERYEAKAPTIAIAPTKGRK